MVQEGEHSHGSTHDSPHHPLPLSASEISSMTHLQVLQAALNQSSANGTFIDTKFYAFSRLRATGVVDKPLPVYANSAVLQIHSSYFDGFFSGEFSEARIASLRGGFPEDKGQSNDSYEYDSDSDLDDDSDTDSENGQSTGKGVADQQSTRAERTDSESPSSVGEQAGRVIVLPDVAHTTLKAMVHFLYFGTVNFSAFTSTQTQTRADAGGASTTVTVRPTAWDAPLCSPKSMYRLADKFGLTELRNKAKESIKLNLTTDNITTELRSSITSTYDEIREMMIQFACERSRLPLVLAMLPEWLDELATGRIPRAASTISAVIQKVTSVQPPPPTSHDLPCSGCLNPLDMSRSQCYCRYCQKWQSPVAPASSAS